MPQITHLRDTARLAVWLKRAYALVMAAVILIPAGAMPSLAACPDAEELQEEAAIGHCQLEERIRRRDRHARSDVGYSVNGRVLPPIHVSSNNSHFVVAAGATQQQRWPHLASAPLRL